MSLALAVHKPTNESCRALCVSKNFDDGKKDADGCACIVKYDNYEFFIHNRVDLSDIVSPPLEPSEEKKKTYYDF